MRCLTILLDFWHRFQTKINANSLFELNMSKNGKPSKTLRGQAKIKVLLPRNEQKKRKIVSKSLRTKKTSKSCRICRLAERLGLAWGAENERFAHILQSFSKRSKNWFAVTLDRAGNQAEAAGRRGFRLSPWSFKVLGLLSLSLCLSVDLLLVALILLVSFSKGRNWLESVPTWI